MSAGDAVVIPAFNEEPTIAGIVRRLRAEAFHVVVVDDGSTDATAASAAGAGAVVLDLPCRLGAWGATQTGVRHALRTGARRVVTMDADGQHDPADARGLLAPIEAGLADVVIGSCRERGSSLRRVAWGLFQALSGLDLQDLTSGFRAYGQGAARALLSAEATLLNYQDMGVLLLLRKQGFRISEVAVRMCPRSVGKSHIFDSWHKVARYMTYTITITCSRR